MKGWRLVTAGGFLALWPTVTAAQPAPSPIVRADATASIGWFNAKEHVAPDETDWYSRSAIGTANFGWFWTNNLKTEIEAGASTHAELYGYWTEFSGPQQVFHSVRDAHSTRRVAASQLYQFFRNRWFHPFLGGGIDVSWRKMEREDYYTYAFNPSTGQNRREEEIVTPETTDVDARPFALVGYKAYMTPRVFFRNDLRLTFGGGIDEVALRFGIGVDLAPGRRQ
jgi:hypothetical protein